MPIINASMHEQFVDEFIKWLDENDIKHYEPFKIDYLWKVPCIPMGKEQKEKFEKYIEYRCNNDLM